MNFYNYDYNRDETQLYNPYEGFIKGNMFPNLYEQYKIQSPYEIRPLNEQAEMLTNIDSLCFACQDLNLYLDVHPDDMKALELFNNYKDEKNNLIKMYESKYGPLTLDSDSLNNYPWVWDDRPWPWEKE